MYNSKEEKRNIAPIQYDLLSLYDGLLVCQLILCAFS